MADILQFPTPPDDGSPDHPDIDPLGNVRLDGLRRSPIDPGDALHALGLGTGIPHAEASHGALEAIRDLRDVHLAWVAFLNSLLESDKDA